MEDGDGDVDDGESLCDATSTFEVFPVLGSWICTELKEGGWKAEMNIVKRVARTTTTHSV